MSDRPTIRDVAELAGVSIATVSRAMNDKGDVSAHTREKVLAAADTLGYVSDVWARALGTRRVAVIVGDNAGHRDLALMFFSKVLGAISRRLGQSGYDPLLLAGVGVHSDLSAAAASAAHGFDAAILIGVDDDDPLLGELAEREQPVVGVDVHCTGPHSAFVGSDHAEGIRLAVSHLYALGHRHIAHIAGGKNTVAGAERLEAFQVETANFGLEVPAEYVRCGDFSSASGYREACALLALDEPPSAIVLASDLMAMAAQQAIWEFGLEPGRDLSVIGFDDLEPASLAHPPLTTIRQDREAIGSMAAARAIELLEHEEIPSHDTLLPVELIVRASTAPPAA